MPVMTEAPGEKKLKFKMKMVNPEYMTEHGGWLDAGGVVVVDEETAIRWLENGIAVQAGKDEQTAQEIRRAKLREQLRPVEDDEVDAPPRLAVGSPRRRGRPSERPQLQGAGVVNSLLETPDDVTVSDEDEE